MPEADTDRLVPASALSAWQRRSVRVPLVVAAFCLGMGATAGVYTMQRTTGAGESVMLDRDVSRVKPRAVSTLSTVQVREAPKRRIVAVTSVASNAEPARFDRVLALSDALAQCAPETFFSRLACEQRARSRYCDGAAGRIPQCPQEFAADHAQ